MGDRCRALPPGSGKGHSRRSGSPLDRISEPRRCCLPHAAGTNEGLDESAAPWIRHVRPHHRIRELRLMFLEGARRIEQTVVRIQQVVKMDRTLLIGPGQLREEHGIDRASSNCRLDERARVHPHNGLTMEQ